MEEVQPLPENLSFVVLLNAQPLPDVQTANAFLKQAPGVVHQLSSSNENLLS